MVSTVNELRSGDYDARSPLHHRTKQLSMQKVMPKIGSDVYYFCGFENVRYTC